MNARPDIPDNQPASSNLLYAKSLGHRCFRFERRMLSVANGRDNRRISPDLLGVSMLPYRVAIQPRLNGSQRETAKEYLMMNVVDGMTERLLDDAGIGPGMRVLVIGCGPGAVSFMMAQRVGEKGHVYGVMLELERAAECERGLSNVRFV